MVRNVLTVAESETGSANELVLLEVIVERLFIQAGVGADVSAPIDGVHSLMSNQVLIEHLPPLLVVLIPYVPIAPYLF